MILELISIMLWSFVLHETGHLITLRKYTPYATIFISLPKTKKEKVRVQTGTKKDIYNLTISQRIDVFITGVLLGAFPILISVFFVNVFFVFVLWLWYIYGCWSDIKYLFLISKRGV